jgi:drug/metabolite transporter (DMT)-like permease
MNEAGRQRRMLVLCLATVWLVWGVSYVATRVGVQELPPLLFGGVRYLLAGMLLTSVALWRGFRPAQRAGQWWHMVAMSLLLFAVSNGLQVWAMQWVPAHTGALLNASSALWIVLFGLTGRRAHHPGLLAVAGLVVGFAGTALLMWPQGASDAATTTPLVPQLAILGACVLWSLGTIYMRNHSLHIDLFALVGLQMLLGGVWMTLAGLSAGEAARWHWSLPGFLAMVYLMFTSSCLAHLAYAWLARNATPAQTGSYSYVNPAITALVGFLALGERMTPLQMTGAAVILAGVLLINWPGRAAT